LIRTLKFVCLLVTKVVTMDSVCILVTKMMLRIFTVCLRVARVIRVVLYSVLEMVDSV